MQEQNEHGSHHEPCLWTRRTVLGGLVTAVFTPAMLAAGASAQAEGAPFAGTAAVAPLVATPIPRAFHTVTMLSDGRFLVAGGVGSGNRALSSVQIYDPQSDTWTNAAAMATARFQHAATLLADGRVLVTGGLHRASNPLSSGEIYSPVADAWTPAPAMSLARFGHTLSLQANGSVVVMGGCSAGPLSSVEMYSPAAR